MSSRELSLLPVLYNFVQPSFPASSLRGCCAADLPEPPPDRPAAAALLFCSGSLRPRNVAVLLSGILLSRLSFPAFVRHELSLPYFPAIFLCGCFVLAFFGHEVCCSTFRHPSATVNGPNRVVRSLHRVAAGAGEVDEVERRGVQVRERSRMSERRSW